MKNVYSKLSITLLCLLAVIGGMSAQNLFVDLEYQDDYEFQYNNPANTLSIRNKAVMPVALPEIPVETENIFVLESAEMEGYQDWWNAAIKLVAEPQEITEENNYLRTIVYSTASEMQIILRSDVNNEEPLYHFKQVITPNQWNTIDIDLSSPYFLGKKVGKIEFAPMVPNTVSYIYPYWESSSSCISESHIPVYESLSNDSIGKFYFRSNAAPGTTGTEIVPFTSELKEGLPADINPENIFKLTSANSDVFNQWWYVNIWQLHKGSYRFIPKDYSVLKVFVKSNQDKIVIALRDSLGVEAWYHSSFTYDVKPNEWSEIHIDFTGRPDAHFASIEMGTFYADATAYVCPVFCKEVHQPSTSVVAAEAVENLPYLSNGIIKVDEEAQLKLYNTLGQCIESNYGKTVKAIKGLNIVQVNGVSYKLMNK